MTLCTCARRVSNFGCVYNHPDTGRVGAVIPQGFILKSARSFHEYDFSNIPTAHFAAVFIRSGDVMFRLFILVAAIVFLNANAMGVSVGSSECTRTDFPIVNGIRQTITNPNGTCMACMTYPCYQCICNLGYGVNITNTENGDCNCSLCGAGYYDRVGVCVPCPKATDIYIDASRKILAKGTSPVGATSTSQCYLGTGIYYDITGRFSITQSCTYK